MAKFCKNCGTMVKDTDMACPQCGNTVETPQKDAADNLFKKIGLVIGIIVLITIVANIIGANTGYKGAIKRMVKCFENNKTEKLIDMSSSIMEEYCEMMGYDEFDEYCEDQIEDARERIEDEVGSIKKITYKITSVEKAKREDLKEMEETFEELGLDVSVKKAYEVSVSLKIKGAKGEKDDYISIIVLKEKGKWKILKE